MKKNLLTGIKPTGTPHLGNYLGMIRPGLDLLSKGDFNFYVFVADYHALTTIKDREIFNELYYSVAATWLALGLDYEKATLYRQSDIPEIFELTWILSCFTPKGLMNRSHAYKSIAQSNKDNKSHKDDDYNVNMGIYTYPILMASDILLFDADIVPVGKDQEQHVEIARDIAQSFNHIYGDIIQLPEAYIKSEVGTIPGADGRKMSKSYDNTIPLFAPEKKLRKLINKIKTDSLGPTDPKDPDNSLIFDLYRLFATSAEVELFKNRYLEGISWGDAKAELFEKVNTELKGPREKYETLINDKGEIDRIIKEGSRKAREKAAITIDKIRKAIGKS